MRRLLGASRPLSDLIMLVTPQNRAAVAEAVEFQENSAYAEYICGKSCNGGVKEKTFTESLDRLDHVDITNAERDFYDSFFHSHSGAICCLPKGHSGKCRTTLAGFFTDKFANKIKDCNTAPGADDVLFKNRCKRSFPIQVTKRQETTLRSEYNLKQKVKLKAGIPLENAGTNFTVATAEFDFAALLLLQKGVTYTMPADIKEALHYHALRLVIQYNKRGIFIVKDGYLCDPILGDVLEPEWYTIDDDRSPYQIQFGHVTPLSDTKFMTRGGNVLPLTRRANLIQSDTPLDEVAAIIKQAYQHTNPGGLSDRTAENCG